MQRSGIRDRLVVWSITVVIVCQVARFSSPLLWPIGAPGRSLNILTFCALRSASCGANALFGLRQSSCYLITCTRYGCSPLEMMIFHVVGSRSRAVSQELSDSEAFLWPAPPKENIACGNDATGNTPFRMRATSNGTWTISITIRSSTGCSNALVIGLSRRFIGMSVWGG